jgi:hypothetical protein
MGDLFPSIEATSSLSRLIIWLKSHIQIVPNLRDTYPMVVQAGVAEDFVPDNQLGGIPSQVYKNISLVNPTNFCVNLKSLSRYSPTVLRPIKIGSTAGNTDALAITTRVPTYTGVAPVTYFVRITSYCMVFPQDTPLNRTITSRVVLDDLDETDPQALLPAGGRQPNLARSAIVPMGTRQHTTTDVVQCEILPPAS